MDIYQIIEILLQISMKINKEFQINFLLKIVIKIQTRNNKQNFMKALSFCLGKTNKI
jgi:hypothetical protein